ncbi:MAG: hypothetical protein ABIK28_22845 [Planctomycetota bacterium]
MQDYQRHYRSRFPHLIDANRKFEKQYNRDGWPFHMIVEDHGDILYAETKLVDDDLDMITAILDLIVPKKPEASNVYGNTNYMEETCKRHDTSNRTMETFPNVISDFQGDLYLSYTTNRNKENEVYLRFLKKGEGRDEVLVSEGLKDAYYSTMALDFKDRLWVFFSALADSGRYDIFARYWKAGKGLSDIENITEASEDAMYPDAKVDSEGRIWLAYYGWEKMGNHSRDKEVYARYLDGKEWSEEAIHLSPDDVPDYEDHTDPTLAVDSLGNVYAAWSWDLHPLEDPKYSRYQESFGAENPTLFGRRFNLKDPPGALLFLGHTGIDAAPEIYCDVNDKLWCAWNSFQYSETGYKKALYVSDCKPDDADYSTSYMIESDVRDICTPRFVEQSGRLHLIWCSQDQEKVWRMKLSLFLEAEEYWSDPETIVSEGNPRFPSIALDGNGVLQIVYSKAGGKGWSLDRVEVDLRKKHGK